MDATTDPEVPCYLIADDCNSAMGMIMATIENCCANHNALSYYDLYPTNGTTASCIKCPGILAMAGLVALRVGCYETKAWLYSYPYCCFVTPVSGKCFDMIQVQHDSFSFTVELLLKDSLN